MRNYLHKYSGYFIGLLAFFSVGITLLLCYGKADSFKVLNRYRLGFLNEFFINVTFMGDGIFALCLTAACLFYFKRKQQGLAILYAFLFSGIIAQIIKKFSHAPRPRLFFEPGQYLHFIDGISMANTASFPSGHTTTAFAVATVLLLSVKHKKWQWLLLCSSVLIGYSRIYLGQHFLLDVMVGAAIGTASGLVIMYLMEHGEAIKLWWVKKWGVKTADAIPATRVAKAL